MKKFHLSAIIKRSVHYDKTSGKTYSYKEEDHSRQLLGHDKMTDSRVVEATSLEEAQKLFDDEIRIEHTYEEQSSRERISIDSI